MGITKEQKKAYSDNGKKGGKAIALKRGKKGMSELGKAGAKKRWANHKKLSTAKAK